MRKPVSSLNEELPSDEDEKGEKAGRDRWLVENCLALGRENWAHPVSQSISGRLNGGEQPLPDKLTASFHALRWRVLRVQIMTAAGEEQAYDMGGGAGTLTIADDDFVSIADEMEALCQEFESVCHGLGRALGCVVAHLAQLDLALTDAMDQYKKIPRVQSKGCCLLGDLAGNLPVRITNVWIDVVFRAMRNLPHTHAVQKHGCWAIANFVFNKEQVDLACQGVDFVLYAMRRFPDFEELQEHGCLALGKLASIAACRTSIIVARTDENGLLYNGADVIMTAQQTHTDEQIVRYAQVALHALN